MASPGTKKPAAASSTAAPSLDEMLAQKAQEIDAELQELNTSDERSYKTIDGNAERRRALLMERLQIPTTIAPRPASSRFSSSSGTRVRKIGKATVSAVASVVKAGGGQRIMGIVIGTLIGGIVAFIVALIVQYWIPILSPITWAIWLVLVLAGALIGYSRAVRVTTP